MASVKYKGRWYEDSSLSNEIKKELGILKDDFNEKEILEELKKTPKSVKKSRAKERKKGKDNVISSPSLKEN